MKLNLQTLVKHKTAISVSLFLGVFYCIHYVTGTPNGHSYIHNLPWYEGFSEAFWNGDLYPRFLPNLWFGLGGVDFFFYAPMPFWLTAIFGELSCLGCDTSTVFSIGGMWMIAFSGLAFYALARRYFTTHIALLGSVIYMFLPYHYLIDWAARQAVGEIAAMIFLPLLLLATIKLCEDKNGGRLFAAAFAATLLSHLPTALIAAHLIALGVGLWALSHYTTWTQRGVLIARFALWAGLGLLLSAFYWVPALALLPDSSADMLYVSYAHATNWLLLDGRPEPSPSTMFAITPVLCMALILMAAAVYALRGSTAKQTASLKHWILVPCLSAAFLMSVFAFPIWQYWILKTVQFPWRALVFVDIAAALSVMTIIEAVLRRGAARWKDRSTLILSMSLLAIPIATLFSLPQAQKSYHTGLEQAGSYQPLGAIEYLSPQTLGHIQNTLAANPAANLSYAEKQARFFAEFSAVQKAAYAALLRADPAARVTVGDHDRIQIDLTLSQPQTVPLPLGYWPHWRATLSDGRELRLSHDVDLGVLAVTAPAGDHEIRLDLPESPAQHISGWLSLASWLVFLLAWVTGTRPVWLISPAPVKATP